MTITPEDAADVIRTATASMIAAITAMKAQASIAAQVTERPAIGTGIDLSLEALRLFEQEVNKAVPPPVDGNAAWRLTLPVITDTPDERDADPRDYLSPWQWPNDWTMHGNMHTMIVSAPDEAEARRMAADYDCGIWLDADYARCEPLPLAQAVVLLAVGGEAENE